MVTIEFKVFKGYNLEKSFFKTRMIKIALVIQNKPEEQILLTVFKQKKLLCKPVATEGYLQLRKDVPDVILIEFPPHHLDQLAFIQQVKKNKQLSSIPILGYGNQKDQGDIDRFCRMGCKEFIKRPLKIMVLLNAINECIQDKKDQIEEDLTTMDVAKGSEEDIIKKLLDPQILGSEKIVLAASNIGKLIAFPFTIAKVAKLADNNESNARDLARVIQSDQSMASNIIKVANTVFFAGKTRVSKVSDAIVRIGFNETKKIALTLSVMKIVDQKDKSFGFSRNDFWYHSLSTAIIAEQIAKISQYNNSSQVYLAGLLHEFMVLLYDEYFRTPFEKMISLNYDEYKDIDTASTDIIGIKPGDITNELFEKWKIPASITKAISHHKNYNDIREKELDADALKVTKIIGVANIIAKSAMVGCSADQAINDVSDDILKELKIMNTINDSFMDRIYSQLLQFISFFGLEKRQLPSKSPCLFVNPKTKVGVIQKTKRMFNPVIFNLGHTGVKVVEYNSPTNCSEDFANEPPNLILLYGDNSVPHSKPFIEFIDGFNEKDIVGANIPRFYVVSSQDKMKIVPEGPNNYGFTFDMDISNLINQIEKALQA